MPQKETNAEQLDLVMVSNDNGAAALSDIDELINSRLIGFVFATYIILQSDKNVFVVDQHASHERILYEKFLEEKKQGKEITAVTSMLIPRIVKLSVSDYAFLSDNISDFSDKGFDIELLDDREIAIRALPFSVEENKVADYMFEMIEQLRKDVQSGDNAWYASIATMACKAAIKGHDMINKEEVYALLNGLKTLEDPYHCPHGRPTFIKYSQTDIEKMFKRIV